MHEMQTTATDVPVAWCVNQSVYHATVPCKKKLNGSRSGLIGNSLGPKTHCIRWGNAMGKIIVKFVKYLNWLVTFPTK